MYKICINCKQEKDITCFQKDKRNKTGYKNQCKNCKNIYAKQYRLKNISKFLEKERLYKIKLRNTLQGKKKLNKIQQKYRKKMIVLGLYKNVRGNRKLQSIRWRNKKENKIKKSCHNKVYLAIKNGLLKKESCVICGNTKSVAHHEDYNKPFNIIWFCNLHHYIHHKKTGFLGSQQPTG